VYFSIAIPDRNSDNGSYRTQTMDWNDCNASNRCCSSTSMRVSSMNLLLVLLYSCANMSCTGLQVTSAFGQLLLQVPAYNIRMSSNSMSNPDVLIPASFPDFTQA
jgi:hypothetical protein